MDSQNVVSIARAYGRQPANREVTAHQYAEVVKNRNTYRRLYDQNTAALAQARGHMEGLRQQMRDLERELDAHRAGAPLALLHDAMQMLTDMVTGTRAEERELGAIGVRLPSATTAHLNEGEALIDRAAPLVSRLSVKK